MAITLTHFLLVKERLKKNLFQTQNYNVPQAFNLAYLKYRLIRPILKNKYLRFQKKHQDYPWLCPDAIKALKELLPNQDIGFEFGSGRSTTFFAPFFQVYWSIEHHAEWYESVNNNLKEQNVDHVRLNYIPPDTTFSEPKLTSEQQFGLPASAYPVKDECFLTYTSFLSQFPDRHFDFLLIDGRARRTCALLAIPKLKVGGMMVLDNSERARYRAIHEQLRDWEKITTTTGLTDTTIWLKPAWE